VLRNNSFQGVKKRFKITLEDLTVWEKLREVYYRRNVFVHRDGRIDKNYLENIGSQNGELGDNFSIDMNYCDAATQNIIFSLQGNQYKGTIKDLRN
jgi:hypothetical protein